MQFLEFYKSLLPYLALIPVGIFIGRKHLIPKSWITRPLLFFLMPWLVINHFQEAESDSLLTLAAMGFSLAILMLIPGGLLNKHVDNTYNPNLIRSSFSFYNVAFFGIPTVIAIFGEDSVTHLICIYIGTALYGDLIGYFQVARTNSTAREAFHKLLKVPFLYAFISAILFRVNEVEIPPMVKDLSEVFGVVVSATGMLIVGMNCEKVNFRKLDWSFIPKMLGTRLLSGVILAGVFLLLENTFVASLETEQQQMFALLPLFPIAANITVFASYLNANEEDSAIWILASMGLSLVLIPLAIGFF
ncbi:AEC family transporter [Negadavirga shengliensis]|uniref:AEC family transporter n=1 Tax=Negadavirga shengliensis TaxID=1389218 RepID=A0ABV9SWX3_9BACT